MAGYGEWDGDWVEDTRHVPQAQPGPYWAAPADYPPPSGPGAGRSVVIAVLSLVVVVLAGLLVFLVISRPGTDTGGTGRAAAVSGLTDPAAQDPGAAARQAAPGQAAPPQQAAPEQAAPAQAAPPPQVVQTVPGAGGNPGGSATAPDSGVYSGYLSQRGTSSGRQDRDYTVEMTFSSGGSSVRYPSLGCSGTLSPQGDSGGSRVYTERITSGNCDPSGTWTIQRESSSSIAAEYRPASGNYVVVGELTR